MAHNASYTLGLILAAAVGAGGYYAYDTYVAKAPTDGTIVATDGSVPLDETPVVVTVNGQKITQAMLDHRKELVATKVGGMFAQLPPAEQDRVIKENLILEALVDQNMKDSDIANDPKVVSELQDSRQQVLRTAYLEKLADAGVTEELLRKSYDAQIGAMPDTQEVHARHILVKDKAKAEDLIAQLNGGAKFEELAKENSLDKGNSAQGGDLGFFSKEQMVPEFAGAVFAMEAGQVTKEPIKTGFGWHVVEVIEKRTMPKPSFEEVRDSLAAQERQKFIKGLVEQWRNSAAIDDKSAAPVAESTDALEATTGPEGTPPVTPTEAESVPGADAMAPTPAPAPVTPDVPTPEVEPAAVAPTETPAGTVPPATAEPAEAAPVSSTDTTTGETTPVTTEGTAVTQ